MWFALLDGFVVGAVVALVLARPWRPVASLPAVAAVGVTGGVVGAGLGFTLLAASTSSGPLQVTPLLAGLVGALLTLVVLRQWTLGDRAAAAAAVADARRREAAAAKARRRADRRAPKPPSALAELVVLGLAALRRR